MSDKKFSFNYLLTTQSIAVSYESKHYMVTKAAEPYRYDALKKAILDRDAEAFVDALIPKKRVIKYSNEYFEIDDKNNLYMLDDRSTVIPDIIAKRLIEFSQEGLPIEPLVYFWKKLRKNPSKNSQEMLYGFLEANHHPITENGNFLAYKKVSQNGEGKLVDSYSKKMDNSVGAVVSMPREQVVEDKNQTCSRGLHVAAWEYAQNFSGTVLVEVIVDPTDVVSVPVDYHNQKMRVCRYKVSCVIDYGKPIKENLKSDRNEKEMEYKVSFDAEAIKRTSTVDFTAMTVKEIIDMFHKVQTSVVDANVSRLFETPKLREMNPKNKQSIVNKVKKILEEQGFTVITGAPKSR